MHPGIIKAFDLYTGTPINGSMPWWSLPEALLGPLIDDADLLVRREVARRLSMPALQRMTGDCESEVRRIVAERLPASLLDVFVDDPDLLVRWEVAGRALSPLLETLTSDPEPEIRQRARARLSKRRPPSGHSSHLKNRLRAMPGMGLAPADTMRMRSVSSSARSRSGRHEGSL